MNRLKLKKIFGIGLRNKSSGKKTHVIQSAKNGKHSALNPLFISNSEIAVGYALQFNFCKNFLQVPLCN